MPRAIISVFDKTGLLGLAHGLQELGWDLAASGGTRCRPGWRRHSRYRGGRDHRLPRITGRARQDPPSRDPCGYTGHNQPRTSG